LIVLLHASRAFGAVEHYVCAVARGLREQDEDSVLLHPDHPELAPFAELAGGRLRVESFQSVLVAGSSLRLAAHLRRTLRALEPRVVHVLELWPQALVAGRLAGAGLLLLTHHTPELPRRDNLAGRLWLQLGWLARPKVIYTSESDRARARRRLPSTVIELGINLDRFSSARRALVSNGRRVGIVGRLVEQKGHRFLLEAAPEVLDRHPDVQLVVVGEGPLRAELEALAGRLGVTEHVVFMGARDDVPELMASFDVYVQPSLFEGLCLSVIEAQTVGVPVVATPVGGMRETVVPGVTGLSCTPGDPGSLAAAIVALLDGPVEGAKLAAEAQRRALARFSERRMVERTLGLYG
jgi:glycosyltransferase involved in cell wall biosynthesis